MGDLPIGVVAGFVFTTMGFMASIYAIFNLLQASKKDKNEKYRRIDSVTVVCNSKNSQTIHYVDTVHKGNSRRFYRLTKCKQCESIGNVLHFGHDDPCPACGSYESSRPGGDRPDQVQVIVSLNNENPAKPFWK